MPIGTMNIEEIRARFAVEQARSDGGSTTYMKMTGGQNVLRLLPGVPPFLRVRRHKYQNSMGHWQNSLDLAWLTQTPELLEPALESGKISNEDVALARQFGDPFVSVGQAAKNAGLDKSLYQGVWPQTRYFFNVVDRSKTETVALWDSSKTMFDGVMNLMDQYPELFDTEEGFDLLIQGNGQDGIKRRYSPAMAARAATPVGFDYEDKLIDLDEVALRGVVSFKDKLADMYAKYGDIAVQVGMGQGDWGV